MSWGGLEMLWVLLGRFWDGHGAVWLPLLASWGCLGVVLGHVGPLPWRSWALAGPIFHLFWLTGEPPNSLKNHEFCLYLDDCGLSWGRLGLIWPPF